MAAEEKGAAANEQGADVPPGASARTMPAGMKYPGLLTGAYASGAILDLRARFAVELIKSPAAAEIAKLVGIPSGAGKAAAVFALEAVEELFRLAEEKGYIAELQAIDGPDLLDAITKTAARIDGAAQVEMQVGSSSYAAWQSVRQNLGADGGPRILRPVMGPATEGDRVAIGRKSI